MAGLIKIGGNPIISPNGDYIPTGKLGSWVQVDGTSASAASAVLSTTEDIVVRIVCHSIAALGGNTIGFYEIGTTPTASASTKALPYNGFVWDGVLPAGYKIAAYNCKIDVYYI